MLHIGAGHKSDGLVRIDVVAGILRVILHHKDQRVLGVDALALQLYLNEVMEEDKSPGLSGSRLSTVIPHEQKISRIRY